jgi:hypothetical protein
MNNYKFLILRTRERKNLGRRRLIAQTIGKK